MRFPATGAQRASRHFRSRLVAGMLTMLVLTGLQFAVTAPALAAVAPKVAIIVGPAGATTSTNLAWGRAAAAEARRYTSNVVEVYTPYATWSRAKAAMTGASVVVYIGRGRGFPSPFSATLRPATEDGFGCEKGEVIRVVCRGAEPSDEDLCLGAVGFVHEDEPASDARFGLGRRVLHRCAVGQT